MCFRKSVLLTDSITLSFFKVKKFKDTPRELAYFSLSNSSSTWEVNIAHSWKILPLELATWLEHQWSQGMKKAQMRDYINVSLQFEETFCQK